MKVKDIQRFVKCDVCGAEQEDKDEKGTRHLGHTMIVVSVYNPAWGWPEAKDKRKYYDLCSMKCLAAFAQQQDEDTKP